jgi:predicted ATPase
VLTLKQVTIHKFKCIESDQTFEVDPAVTVLVGMNESGKTSILQALAKTRYFTKDAAFRFNPTHDFPRKEKKRMDKSGETPKAVTCTYGIAEELVGAIAKDIGPDVFTPDDIIQHVLYDNRTIWTPPVVDANAFVAWKTKQLGVSSRTLDEKLVKVRSVEDLDALIGEYQDENLVRHLKSLRPYFANEWKWPDSHPLCEYVARRHLSPHLPKFLYYDEYYALPSRISIEKLRGEELEEEQLKTAKALFDLADINVDEVLKAEDFEDFKAELEATEATITQELFNYWSTNTNLEIQFDIDKIENTHPQRGTRIVEHVLDIRVRNNRTKMSLPLRHRSKGFNWFFSFLVWFKKIQEDKDSNYVLLLDEPGLNLHASAQHDLLKFIEDLSTNYQILYTTHSPFMVDPEKLHRVRTILETVNGSQVSDSLQEKDPNTLFPLQAALGYDIAQNLFISKHNLIVEGVSDLIFLQAASGTLASLGRTGLRDDIVIVPVGGLDKVSTFVSLLRGSSLNMVCLVDSSIDPASKAQLDNLVASKIIKRSKVLQFDQFVDGTDEADIEDMFEVEEYLSFFNAAFREHNDISPGDLNADIPRLVVRINKVLGVERYNHYRPARQCVQDGSGFSDTALARFEAAFKKINELM